MTNPSTPPPAAPYNTGPYAYGNTAPAIGASHFTPRNLLNLFLERWWIGLIAAVVAVAIFMLAQPRRAPVYRTEVKLLFEPRKDQVIGIKEVVDTTTTSNLELNLHIEQMYSNTFFDYVQASFSPREIEQIQAPYRDPENPSAPPPSLAAIIRPNLDIAQQKATTIVRVIVQNRDPEVAALIANRFARKYIDFTIDKAVTGTNSAIVFLKTQSEEKRAEVEAVERAMQEYRAKHNMAALGETQGLVQQKLGLLGSDLSQAELQQTNLRTLLDTIAGYRKDNKNIFEISAITSAPNVSALKGQLDVLAAQRAALAERYLEQHPVMRQNAIATADISARLDAAIDLAIADIQARFNLANLQEQRLRKEYVETEKQAQELDRININYKFLADDAQVKRNALNAIIARLNDTTIVSQLDNVNIKIMDKAWVPALPSNNTPSQVLLQASAIGFVLFLGVPLLLGLLDSRVKSTTDVETGLQQTLLGGIKTMKKLTETERPNVFRLGKDDALSEAYRGIFSEIEIRSNIAFPKRILVTSSVPAEGKSLTASNLAAVFAAHGRKTLLVDCDFRRPSLRRYFGTPPQTGLLPWVRAQTAAAAKPQPDGAPSAPEISNLKSQIPDQLPPGLGIANIAPNFDLLPAGDAVKNPTEIIDQIAATDLFNRLSRHYDVLLLDTPPAVVFPDALLLSRFCAEMIYVCRFKTVRKALIKKTLTKFTDSGIASLGVVLNCVPHSSMMNYGYSGYGAYDADYYKSYQREKAAT